MAPEARAEFLMPDRPAAYYHSLVRLTAALGAVGAANGDHTASGPGS